MKRMFNHTKRPREEWGNKGQNYDWDEIYQESEEEYSKENYYAEEDAEDEDDGYEPVMEYDRDEYAESVAYTEDVHGEGIEYVKNSYEESIYAGGSAYAEGNAYAEDSTVYEEDGAVYEESDAYAADSVYAEDGTAYDDSVYEDNTVYEEGAYAEDNTYAEDPAYEVGSAYEDSAYADSVYAEDGTVYENGVYEEDVYEDGVYEDDSVYNDSSYAEDSAYAEEGAYEDSTYEDSIYADSEYEDDIVYEEDIYEDQYADSRTGRKGGIFGRLWENILDMSGLDRIITITGAAVLLLAVVTAGVLLGTSVINKQISEFVTVGKQLDGIDTIGEQGLVVLTDNRIAKLQAAAVVEDEQNGRTDYDESDYNKDVTVSLETTSIFKDLKIKFINSRTEKLIANVPFAVTVTKPDGKSEIWSDDDMDGIIYKKDITAGNYTLSVNELTGEKYESYTLPTNTKTVEVKKDIAYKKVDVKNEIKKESEINLSKEEAKKNQLAVESTLQDTVAWVESTQTALTYREVSKSTIPDPRTLARSGKFMRLTEVTEPTTEAGSETSSETQPSETPSGSETSSETQTTTESTTPSATEPETQPDTPSVPAATLTLSQNQITLEAGNGAPITATTTGETGALTASSDNPGIAAVEGSGHSFTVKAVAAGTATVTVTAESGLQAFCTVIVTAAKNLQLDKNTLSLNPQGTGTIKVTLEGGSTINANYVTSSNTNVATVSVDNNNTITVAGVAAGEAVITVTHPGDAGRTATCRVTVAAAGSIGLNKNSMTLIAGGKDTITVALDNSKTLKAENVTSSDTNVATVEVSDNTITVTGVAAGSADITVKHPDADLTETCTVTVKDGNGLLKDKDGNQIYIIENDQYREAKYTDYDAIQQDQYKVYIKGDAKYTGWQTLDGKVYFFNANGDKVTGEQVIQGAKYNFASDGSLVQGGGTMGIDVSKYNGNIDWNAVKNSGVSYVIIRVGYRGYTQGSLVDDSKFATNIKGATAAGLKVGVYFFTQAVDQVEAVEEASMVLERIKGYTISYPVFLDVEPSGGKGRADSLSKETRTAVCKAFCETIQNSGYTAGIYANKTWLNEKIDTSQLSAYKIWLAQYAATPTYKGRYDMWQYKSTGKVSGISGNVDMNISYLGY
ncbi:MAG: Ig-like domain-containing protein [Bacteroidales bacterium]|nr:Ig-like domain-containing protein [Lachnoclostridium sp.]MCM1383449.1 Ig-like domain-containing protein [Lachnoclostridium sp.]MCM1464298.1 Ig-like domain-containing protein [Bacteroidales bacterium]